jgi:hypothetical protein
MTRRPVGAYTERMMTSGTYQFYTIRIEGRLDPRWSEWFDGMSITHVDEPPGETILSGSVADQAALHGLLTKIRDLNLPLIAVTRS